MTRNTIFSTLLMLGALLFGGRAEAQQIPQGPFQDVPSLVQAWQQFDPAGAGYVYVNGTLVFSRFGFGPAASGRYFICPQDSLIKLNCPAQGPFQNSQAIINYWRQADPWGATYLYLNGQLIEYRMGFGPANVQFYVTCNNRPGGGLMTNCNL
jgi:hypothetical protein